MTSNLPTPAEACAPCHLCGHPSVMDADGKAWCEGCLHAAGSCCGCWENDEGVFEAAKAPDSCQPPGNR